MHILRSRGDSEENKADEISSGQGESQGNKVLTEKNSRIKRREVNQNEWTKNIEKRKRQAEQQKI